MKQMIETFVTLFIVMLSVMIMTQFIGASSQISAAKKFHSNCIGQIEASDFDVEVIQNCINIAAENGYQLEVEENANTNWICSVCNHRLSGNNENSLLCENCGKSDAVEYVTDRMCTVLMKYPVQLGFIQLNKEGTLSGYAR